MRPDGPILRALESRILLGDGGLGTRLAGSPEAESGSVPELNLANPELVLRIHREDVEAGADIVVANTFTASRARLGDRVGDVLRAGVRLAREAAGRRRFVAGSIAPGSAPEDLAEKCRVLAAAGCDLLLLETFTDPEELIAACRPAVATGCPVSAQLAKGDVAALERAAESGAAVVGVNCMGPDEAIRALERARPGRAWLAAWPSAGLPTRVGDRTVHPVRPEAFAAAAVRLVELGARIVGGCCGTGAAHLKAAVARVKPEDGP